MKHPKHNLLNAAYMFYYATDVVFPPSSSSAHSNVDVDANAGESSVAAVGTGGEDAKTKKKLETRLNALTADILIIAKQVRLFTPPFPDDGENSYLLFSFLPRLVSMSSTH